MAQGDPEMGVCHYGDTEEEKRTLDNRERFLAKVSKAYLSSLAGISAGLAMAISLLTLSSSCGTTVSETSVSFY